MPIAIFPAWLLRAVKVRLSFVLLSAGLSDEPLV